MHIYKNVIDVSVLEPVDSFAEFLSITDGDCPGAFVNYWRMEYEQAAEERLRGMFPSANVRVSEVYMTARLDIELKFGDADRHVGNEPLEKIKRDIREIIDYENFGDIYIVPPPSVIEQAITDGLESEEIFTLAYDSAVMTIWYGDEGYSWVDGYYDGAEEVLYGSLSSAAVWFYAEITKGLIAGIKESKRLLSNIPGTCIKIIRGMGIQVKDIAEEMELSDSYLSMVTRDQGRTDKRRMGDESATKLVEMLCKYTE